MCTDENDLGSIFFDISAVICTMMQRKSLQKPICQTPTKVLSILLTKLNLTLLESSKLNFGYRLFQKVMQLLKFALYFLEIEVLPFLT